MTVVLHLEGVGIRPSTGPELLSDVTLSLKVGEIAITRGDGGSGKSALAALAAGRWRPDRGRLRLLGEEAPSGVPARTLRRAIGYGMQEPALLPPDRSAAENVALPLMIAGTRRSQAIAHAAELLDWLGYAEPAKAIGPALAPARQAQIGIAQALIARPALAVLDEPLRHGGAPLTQRLPLLIADLAAGGTAFLITADAGTAMPALAGARGYRLAHGRIVREARA